MQNLIVSPSIAILINEYSHDHFTVSNISAYGNVTAATTILFDAAHPSSITLPIVPMSSLPEVSVYRGAAAQLSE